MDISRGCMAMQLSWVLPDDVFMIPGEEDERQKRPGSNWIE